MADTPYSPRLRTAVVLCGAGTAGAYQAGVLRALSEAGVKVDLLAAHGAGVITALCNAIDGGARLWDPKGPWTNPSLRRAYRWRLALRLAAWGVMAAAAALATPLIVLVVAALLYALSLLAGLVNLPHLSASLIAVYQRSIAVLFQPPLIPTVVPRTIVLAVLLVLGVLVVAAVRAARQDRSRRGLRGAFWWRLIGAPLEVDEPAATLMEALWQLVRGASQEPRPGAAEIGRRYVEMLADNFGQPGFRELIVGVHDLDARRDLIGAIVAADTRPGFVARRRGLGPREADVVELTGSQRDLLIDFLVGALRLPIASAPHMVPFPADSYWRGESHRVCDRPELAVRLIEESSAAGIEQLILVSPAAQPAVPHGLRSKPLDLRGRMGEMLRSVETSALQDAWSAAVSRFSGVFVVRPDHNPIGPFDFGGAYDEASDRRRTMEELLRQGYDDAYRQFIEPVVAAGEKVDVI